MKIVSLLERQQDYVAYQSDEFDTCQIRAMLIRQLGLFLVKSVTGSTPKHTSSK